MHIKKIFTSYIRRLSIQKLVIFKRKDSEKKSRRTANLYLLEGRMTISIMRGLYAKRKKKKKINW